MLEFKKHERPDIRVTEIAITGVSPECFMDLVEKLEVNPVVFRGSEFTVKRLNFNIDGIDGDRLVIYLESGRMQEGQLNLPGMEG